MSLLLTSLNKSPGDSISWKSPGLRAMFARAQNNFSGYGYTDILYNGNTYYAFDRFKFTTATSINGTSWTIDERLSKYIFGNGSRSDNKLGPTFVEGIDYTLGGVVYWKDGNAILIDPSKFINGSNPNYLLENIDSQSWILNSNAHGRAIVYANAGIWSDYANVKTRVVLPRIAAYDNLENIQSIQYNKEFAYESYFPYNQSDLVSNRYGHESPHYDDYTNLLNDARALIGSSNQLEVYLPPFCTEISNPNYVGNSTSGTYNSVRFRFDPVSGIPIQEKVSYPVDWSLFQTTKSVLEGTYSYITNSGLTFYPDTVQYNMWCVNGLYFLAYGISCPNTATPSSSNTRIKLLISHDGLTWTNASLKDSNNFSFTINSMISDIVWHADSQKFYLFTSFYTGNFGKTTQVIQTSNRGVTWDNTQLGGNDAFVNSYDTEDILGIFEYDGIIPTWDNPDPKLCMFLKKGVIYFAVNQYGWMTRAFTYGSGSQFTRRARLNKMDSDILLGSTEFIKWSDIATSGNALVVNSASSQYALTNRGYVYSNTAPPGYTLAKSTPINATTTISPANLYNGALAVVTYNPTANSCSVTGNFSLSNQTVDANCDTDSPLAYINNEFIFINSKAYVITSTDLVTFNVRSQLSTSGLDISPSMILYDGTKYVVYVNSYKVYTSTTLNGPWAVTNNSSIGSDAGHVYTHNVLDNVLMTAGSATGGLSTTITMTNGSGATASVYRPTWYKTDKSLQNASTYTLWPSDQAPWKITYANGYYYVLLAKNGIARGTYNSNSGEFTWTYLNIPELYNATQSSYNTQEAIDICASGNKVYTIWKQDSKILIFYSSNNGTTWLKTNTTQNSSMSQALTLTPYFNIRSHSCVYDEQRDTLYFCGDNIVVKAINVSSNTSLVSITPSTLTDLAPNLAFIQGSKVLNSGRLWLGRPSAFPRHITSGGGYNRTITISNNKLVLARDWGIFTLDLN